MNYYNLKEGQQIYLNIGSMFYEDHYESTILSISPDSFEIRVPYKNGISVPISTGFLLSVKINADESTTEFFTKVLAENKKTNSIILKIPKEFENHTTCKFVTIASGKGGVGKTVFTVNYALALAKKGKKVVIVDADLGMSNIDVLLKLSPQYTLSDLIDDKKTIEDILLSYQNKIKFVPGGSGIQELAHLSNNKFEKIVASLEFLEKNYDYVIIDTGAGLSKNVTNFILCADETIIITTPEPHAIKDAYSLIKVITNNNSDINLKLIINKCETLSEGLSVSNKMIKVSKRLFNCSISPLGHILDSKVVSRSIKEQTPFYITYPSSEPSKSIDFIASCESGYKLSVKNTSQSFKHLGFVSKFTNFFRKTY